jgi:hypothetical protein
VWLRRDIPTIEADSHRGKIPFQESMALNCIRHRPILDARGRLKTPP